MLSRSLSLCQVILNKKEKQEELGGNFISEILIKSNVHVTLYAIKVFKLQIIEDILILNILNLRNTFLITERKRIKLKIKKDISAIIYNYCLFCI